MRQIWVQYRNPGDVHRLNGFCHRHLGLIENPFQLRDHILFLVEKAMQQLKFFNSFHITDELINFFYSLTCTNE